VIGVVTPSNAWAGCGPTLASKLSWLPPDGIAATAAKIAIAASSAAVTRRASIRFVRACIWVLLSLGVNASARATVQIFVVIARRL